MRTLSGHAQWRTAAALAMLSLLSTATCVPAEAQRPVLISGYDDVLRQAENTGILAAAIRSISADETFAGMPELYRILARDASGHASFVIVSATSSWFDSRIRRVLEQGGYPPAQLHLRNWLTQWSSLTFKRERIDAILARDPTRQFIVVFDDSRTSVELLETLLQEFPTRLSAAYLRSVVGREVPAGARQFTTALDIAAHELAAGRMLQEEAEEVARAILAEPRVERIIPAYAHCAMDYDPCVAAANGIASCAAVRSKVAGICGTRR